MVRGGSASLLLALLAVAGCGGGDAGRRGEEGRTERAVRSPVAAMADAGGEGYAVADRPRDFHFPADHGPHPDFRLEWWYFTGNLATGAGDADPGRRFGFQLTFFRQAAAPPGMVAERASAWATRQIYLAHFAVTDVDGGGFHAFERAARGAAGLAGARAEPFRVWLEGWSAESTGEGFLPLRLAARAGGDDASGIGTGGAEVAIDLELAEGGPPVLQGEEGWSRKGPEPGNASYYYSFPRMPARGAVAVGGRRFAVRGEVWLDREWSTSGLSEEQVGWDWFSLQLDDGRELMVYQIRRRDGTFEPSSHGALIAGGTARRLTVDDFELEVLDRWRSPRGGVYPARWRLRLPGEGLGLTVEPLLADQELDVSFRYWEGAVAAAGEGPGGPVTGRGYVELVGYAEP